MSPFASPETTPHSSARASPSTPALIVDLDQFEANVLAMDSLLAGSGKTVRPHVKTHRTPQLAHRQLGPSATGVTCATVGEAEAMVEEGIDDVLVANEVVDAVKIARLASLARRARVAVAVDDAQPVEMIAQAALAAGVVIDILIDIDIRLHRCGVTSIEAAISLAGLVERRPAVRLAGIMGYEGRIRPVVPDRHQQIQRAYAVLSEYSWALTRAGFAVPTVSAGGTSTLREAISDRTVTEIQAGVYALMEPELLDMDLPFRCAASVRSTVISRHRDRVVLDAGRRAIGQEYGPPLPQVPEAVVISVSDEHSVLSVANPPALGSIVELVPSQIRTTFNLHDRVWIARGQEVVDAWPVSARGRSQ